MIFNQDCGLNHYVGWSAYGERVHETLLSMLSGVDFANHRCWTSMSVQLQECLPCRFSTDAHNDKS